MRRAEPAEESERSFEDLLALARGHRAQRVPDRDGLGRVLGLAHDHRVAGLVATRLLASPEDLPPPVRADLQGIVLAHQGRGMLVLLVADEVGRGLSAAGIPCLAIKGAGLIGLVYRSIAERTLGDLDLLVPPEKFPEAEDVLRSLGFDEAVAPRSRRYFLRHHFHVPWKSPRGIGLDLHWDLARPSDGFRYDVARLFDRSVTPQVAMGVCRAPCLPDALLLQSLQHHQEGFASLARAVDIDRIGRALGPAGWDSLVAIAAESGLGSLAWAALVASRELLSTPIPEGVLDRLAARGPIRTALASLRTDRLVRESSAAHDPSLRWLVRLWTAPTARARLRVLADLLVVEPGYWEDRFFVPRELVPISRRLRVRLGRARTALRLAAWQVGRLLDAPAAPSK